MSAQLSNPPSFQSITHLPILGAGNQRISSQSDVLDDIILGLGPAVYASMEKSFPGVLDKVSRICSARISEIVDQVNYSMEQRVMLGLRGIGSSSAVVTTDSVFYLPMRTAPMGQKLIALGPGGCGVFEQLNHRNAKDYYGWFPMPKVPVDNPIRLQYRI